MRPYAPSPGYSSTEPLSLDSRQLIFIDGMGMCVVVVNAENGRMALLLVSIRMEDAGRHSIEMIAVGREYIIILKLVLCLGKGWSLISLLKMIVTRIGTSYGGPDVDQHALFGQGEF
jgi:hypothetical protein